MIKEIAFTAHRVTDLARARTFFEDVLQLKPAEGDGENYQEYDVAGGTFSLHTFGPENVGQGGCEVAFEVSDFDAALQRLRDAAIPLIGEPVTTPVCRMAFIADPDGTPLTIHQRNPERG